MSARDIALVNDILANADESNLVEFKKDNIGPKLIAKLCSALSNAARVANQDFAYVLWGIDDATKQVVGTEFNPDQAVVGNTVLQLWLSQHLSPVPVLSFRRVDHSRGRVVMLEIPAATVAPVCFDSIAYIRIGSATPKLSDHPEQFQRLIDHLRPFTWEKGIAKSFIDGDTVLELLDYPSYFRMTAQNLPDNRQGIFERLEADQLIKPDVGGRWGITHLGAILFANDLDQFDPSLARKAVRFVAYQGINRASMVTHRQDGKKGYATGFEGLVNYINGLLPQNEHIGAAFRESHSLYPERAIRELVANALIHQDMTISGAGPQIELFADRMEIANPGKPLVKPERMIDLPPRSRNEALASLMRRMGLCEEQGSGLDKVITDIETFQLPPLKLKVDGNAMQVALYAPRSFAEMSVSERVLACYQHAVLQWLSGQKMKNAGLCKRLGIEKSNAPQATKVLNAAMKEGLIKPAEPERPRAGYIPQWA